MPVARIQSIPEQWVQIIRLEISLSAAGASLSAAGALEAAAGAFHFAAGQYLEIQHPSGARIPLSIASAPHQLPQLELHYRSTPGDALAPLLDDLLKARGALDLRGPFGDVSVTAYAGPLLLVAGGTGISQALSILEHLEHLGRPTAQAHPYAVTLLWCADNLDAFYAQDRLAELPWLDANCIADARKTHDNDGLAWLGEHLTANAYNRVLLCGGPPFVYAVVDHLKAQQLDVAVESDVFGYSPRG